MADETTMINRIAMILGSKAALKIDFWMDQIRIAGPAIYNVVHYLHNKLAGFAGIKIKFGLLPPGAAAEYRVGENVLRLKNENNGTDSFQRNGRGLWHPFPHLGGCNPQRVGLPIDT